MHARLLLAWLLFGLVTEAAAEAPAETPVQPPPETAARPSVFALPQLYGRYVLLQAQLAELFRQQRYVDAEQLCRASIQLIPHDPGAHYNLACTLARLGKAEAAIAALKQAISLGFNDTKHLEEDQDLASLRDQAEFQELLKQAAQAKRDPAMGWRYTVEPSLVEGGVALVSEKNTLWDARLGVFRSLFRFADAPPDQPPITGQGEAGQLVRQWFQEGTAAGNHGDLYDNHDSDHSNMDYGAFGHLARIEFSDEAKQHHVHHGLQLSFFYNAPTIGNSSTAVTGGLLWRSQARHALTSPRGPGLLFLQYAGNHLYVYPEHRDHDPGHNGADGQGYGDVLPANTPYMIISQGSSGSDRPFLNALAATLAAFRPEVKKELVRSGALMPTVQMILRASSKRVKKPEEYLSGKAHPTVFDSGDLDVVRMVQMAHQITPDVLPPSVQLKVVEEDQAVLGKDFFDGAASEALFDTPCAIARVARSVNYLRRMVVSAESSKDPKGKPLSFHWVVLRGDADRIRIQRRNDAGSVVELLVPYHQRRPVEPGAALESNRVDIGVFVHNGTYYSAPAFISINYLDNEKRLYDAQHRILSVDYADPVVSKNYVDPLLSLPKDWRDEYQYDASGQLLGWKRIRGETVERFTADGTLVTKTSADNRPLEAKKVRYVAAPRPGALPIVQEQVTDEVVHY